jgi:hypothetical protein
MMMFSALRWALLLRVCFQARACLVYQLTYLECNMALIFWFPILCSNSLIDFCFYYEAKLIMSEKFIF